MIYVVCNQKGGVGKTTIASNLAVALSKKGTTILVDADAQESSFKWSQRRSESFPCKTIRTDLKARLITLDSEYEYVVLDVAGSDSEEFRSALFAAHKLIIPTQASQTDIEVLPFMVKLVSAVKQINKGLQPFVVINKAPTNANSTEVEAAQELLRTVPNVKFLNTVIRERKQFRDAMKTGESVLEMGSSKAKDEFNEFLVEIL